MPFNHFLQPNHHKSFIEKPAYKRASNMSSQHTFKILLLATCLFLLQANQCSATLQSEYESKLTAFAQTSLNTQTSVGTSVSAATTSATAAAHADDYRECGSMDIRNHCDSFYDLENCTVITGYLIIVLIPYNDSCDYNNYRFPKLREITDFILIHEIKQLSTFKTIFPNLTVIRGRRLFLNYAMGITRMHALTAIEFPSLVAIKRGHVFVATNPILCSLNMTNFDRLTVTVGQNHILSGNITACNVTEQTCQGCDSGYCWSNKLCQKFENDNILNYQKGIQNCDGQCLGGCDNHTHQGCAVCRSWTDHGVCVAQCPADKYASEHYLRCYTREECIAKRMVIYKNECLSICPTGYKLNNATRECDSCGGINICLRTCHTSDPREPFGIHSLSDVEMLRGCQILNASVIIFIRYRINEQELIDNLKDVTEITGYLKVYNSPYISSLNFFQSLEKINGKPLEHDHYSLVLYNNAKLEDIWPVKRSVELMNGGMYIYQNDRLCNRIIRNFKNNVKHDHSLDSIYMSDLEVLCSPEKLMVAVEVSSHRSFKLSWPKDQTTEEVEILYQAVVGNKPPLLEHNKVDIPICERIHWERELIFSKDLSQNETHYEYKVENLEPHTQYRCMVKTFGREESHEARSELKSITTLPDIPAAPVMKVYKKSFDSLSLQWSYANREDELVDFYRLEVYELPDEKEILDLRDYCEDPTKPYSDFHNEDYDDCCSRKEEDKEDDLFQQQLRQEFACTLDQKEYCERSSLEDNAGTPTNVLLTKRLEHRENNYTIRSLERFHLYSLQIQACNHAGCGSFDIISDRTNYSLAGEKIYDLTACKMPHNNEYRVHFKEPKKPNGLIVTYALHLRYFDSTQGPYLNHMRCLTRYEHESNNYLYVAHLNETFNQIAVRVESLGHRLFTDWIDITTCGEMEDVSTAKVAHHGAGWNIFLVFFLVGCTCGISWICYKRKCWRSLPSLRRYVPLHMSWSNVMSIDPNTTDDRQILVEDFDTVRFQNTPEGCLVR